MVPEETRAQGTIGPKLYIKYLRAGASVVTLLVVLLVNFLAQVHNQQFGHVVSLKGPNHHMTTVTHSFRCLTSCRTGGWPTGNVFEENALSTQILDFTHKSVFPCAFLSFSNLLPLIDQG